LAEHVFLLNVIMIIMYGSELLRLFGKQSLQFPARDITGYYANYIFAQ